MEQISGDLDVAKSRKQRVMEAWRQVNVESSAVVQSCLESHNMEQHFEGIRRALEACAKENVERERLLEERLSRVVAKERRLSFLEGEISRKEEELETMETRVKECAADCMEGRELARLRTLREMVGRKEEELGIVEKRVKECEDDLARSHGALNQCLSMLRDREIELKSVSQLLQECCQEYDLKKSEVDALTDRAAKPEGILKDHALRKDKLDSIKLDIEKKVIELKDKERQHEVFQNSINEQLAVFDVKKEEFESLECSSKRIAGELQARECDLKKATEFLEELKKKIESKNEELASLQGSIAGLSESLEVKKGELTTICCKIDKHNIELAKKEKELESIQMRTKQREEDLQLKEKKAASFRNSISECLNELEYKKRQLSFVNESLSRTSEELEFKKRELEQIQRESLEHQLELEKREKRLNFLQASLDDQCKLLELNEMNFEEKVRDFEHRQWQFQSREKLYEYSQEMRLTERSEPMNCRGQIKVKRLGNMPSSGSLIKAPVSPTISSMGCNTPDDEFMVWKLSGRDPSKQVLHIIEESFERLRSCDDAASRDSIHRKHINLLEQMMQRAPPLLDGTKECALKMAREWELKLKTNVDSQLEVLGFLYLLEVYELVSYFDRHDITSLAEAFSLHKWHPKHRQVVSPAYTNTVPPKRGTWSSSRRFPLRPHRGTKRPLPATDARRLQPPQKRRAAHFDRAR